MVHNRELKFLFVCLYQATALLLCKVVLFVPHLDDLHEPFLELIVSVQLELLLCSLLKGKHLSKIATHFLLGSKAEDILVWQLANHHVSRSVFLKSLDHAEMQLPGPVVYCEYW